MSAIKKCDRRSNFIPVLFPLAIVRVKQCSGESREGSPAAAESGSSQYRNARQPKRGCPLSQQKTKIFARRRLGLAARVGGRTVGSKNVNSSWNHNDQPIRPEITYRRQRSKILYRSLPLQASSNGVNPWPARREENSAGWIQGLSVCRTTVIPHVVR